MKQFIGTVVSTKMEKTVVVEVTRNWKHPLYKKVVKRSKRFPVHFEGMEINVTDRVVIQETRPISKTVHFTVVEKLS